MAKLNTYLIHAQYREENDNDDGPVLFIEHECRLRVKASDITEAIKAAEMHIGTRYSVDSASMYGIPTSLF